MSRLITLDFIQTVAFAGVILFFGYGIRRALPPLARVNWPSSKSSSTFSLSLWR